MYVFDDSTNFVYEYNLNPAWDVTTATSGPTVAFPNGTSDITISSDGTRLIATATDGTFNRVVFEYTLPTPWSVTGAFFKGRMFRDTNFTVAFPGGGPAVLEGTPTGIYYNDELNKFFFVGSAARRVQEINVTPQPALIGTRPVILANQTSVNDRVSINSLQITDTTATTNSTNGALLVAGGVGIQGGLEVGGTGGFLNGVQASSTSFIRWGGRCIMTSPANDTIRFVNSSSNGFNILQLGGGAATHAGIKVNGTGIDIVRADQTGTTVVWTDLRAANITGDNFVVLNNIVTQADDFTLSGADAGKYTRLTKLSGTQIITLTGTDIQEGHEFTFYRATSASLAFNGGTVNGGSNISSVPQFGAFALKHIGTTGSGTFDFI
jgi:hypothetical protein